MKKYILLISLLVLVLTFIQNPRSTTMSQDLVEYHFNSVLIQLPKTADVKENNTVDGELLSYNFYFEDKELSIRGYVQLWKLPDLEKFLVFSKEQSIYDFDAYSLKPIEVGSFNGLINEWNASFGKTYISGHEYWFKKNNGIDLLRIAFLTNKKTFSEEQKNYINRVINTLRWE